jgi:REP element-mobilizing transposase RayT
MPDRRQGYVHRTRGLQPKDDDMAENYRANQRESTVTLGDEHIDLLIEVAQGVEPHLDVTVHGGAADATHLHVVVSWTHSKTFEQIRANIRSTLTRAMNERFGKRTWFSRNPPRKRVRDHGHFDFLMLQYFPGHRRYWVRPEDRGAALGRSGPATQ